jgi:hypothetical protein
MRFVQGKCFLLQLCMMGWKTAMLGNSIFTVSVLIKHVVDITTVSSSYNLPSHVDGLLWGRNLQFFYHTMFV